MQEIHKIKGNQHIRSLHLSMTNKTLTSSSNAGGDSKKTEKALFNLYMNPATEKINMGHFLLALEKTGIRRTDPRLKELIEGLEDVLPLP